MVRDCNIEETYFFYKRVAFFFISNCVPDRVEKLRCRNPWITRYIIHVQRRIKRQRRQTQTNYRPQLSGKLEKMGKQAKHRFYSLTLHIFLKESPNKFCRYVDKNIETLETIVVAKILSLTTERLLTALMYFFNRSSRTITKLQIMISVAAMERGVWLFHRNVLFLSF